MEAPWPIACVTLDLDDTCWPTLPPILRAVGKLEERLRASFPRAADAGGVSSTSLRAYAEEVH